VAIGGGFLSLCGIDVWARFRYLFPSIWALGLVGGYGYPIENVAAIDGFFHGFLVEHRSAFWRGDDWGRRWDFGFWAGRLHCIGVTTSGFSSLHFL
jgi:hypothetical protein